MRKIIGFAAAVALLIVAIVGYTSVMARIGSGAPPPLLAEAEQANEILVIKSARELHLLRDGTHLKSYAVSVGAAPSGHKQTEGDERTPEGRYMIDWRNDSSVAHLSLHISYPNSVDKSANPDPGGNIMIHGLPNGWGFLGSAHLLWDWTNGCIAVTNAEMRDIWSRVPNNTPITIVDTL